MTERPSIAELRLFPAVRWSIREHGGHPSSRQRDQILDERAGDARGMPAIGQLVRSTTAAWMVRAPTF